MDEYRKVMRIRYHQKLFDVYVDDRHRKTFLEVRDDENFCRSLYPYLDDYLSLYVKMNFPSHILYSKKFRFPKKVFFREEKKPTLRKVAGTLGMVLSFEILGAILCLNPKFQKSMMSFGTVSSLDEEIDREISYDTYDGSIFHIDEIASLSEFGMEPVSFYEVRKTLEENINLSPRFKEEARLFLDRLEERFPQVDLRILNQNLKKMYDEINPSYPLKRGDGLMTGSFSPSLGKVSLEENYSEMTAFHELCHALNSFIGEISSSSSSDTYQIHYFFRKDSYGESFVESMNTILADYLLAEDWKNYFTPTERTYSSYRSISYETYQLLKLLKGYSLTDFVNRNVSYFEEQLKKVHLEEYIDYLDTFYRAEYTDMEVVDTKDSLKEELQHSLLKQRILEECGDTVTPTMVYRMAGAIHLCEDQKLDICNEILEEDGQVWLFRTPSSPFYDEDSDSYAYIYQGEEKIFQGKQNDIYIYKSVEENHTVFHMAYYENEQRKYYDLVEKKEIDFPSSILYPIPLNSVCGWFHIDDSHLDFSMDVLKEPSFISYLNSETREVRLYNQDSLLSREKVDSLYWYKNFDSKMPYSLASYDSLNNLYCDYFTKKPIDYKKLGPVRSFWNTIYQYTNFTFEEEGTFSSSDSSKTLIQKEKNSYDLRVDIQLLQDVSFLHFLDQCDPISINFYDGKEVKYCFDINQIFLYDASLQGPSQIRFGYYDYESTSDVDFLTGKPVDVDCLGSIKYFNEIVDAGSEDLEFDLSSLSQYPLLEYYHSSVEDFSLSIPKIKQKD